MTQVFFTVDTELSPGFHQRNMSADENLQRNVFGKVSDGAWGIGYQMSRLNAHGLKGVFFVETLSALVYGIDVLRRVVAAILEAGHDVQLHLHTEWLAWIDRDIVRSRGASLADFDFEDQRRLLDLGMETLVQAGAPAPVAFRAGNYGANNETLRALKSVGIRFDSSYNQPYLTSECRIESPKQLYQLAELDDVVEVPITFFEDYQKHTRPLQLCAVSAAELDWAIATSSAQGRASTVIVSHSFELLNRKRTRANHMVVRRFDLLCAALQRN